ncbi:MAG TPA: hypothetical protein VEL07_16015 [Planctomycetota bacterium]|nr:hypothetical protein [Planctomycetota bacterium]
MKALRPFAIALAVSLAISLASPAFVPLAAEEPLPDEIVVQIDAYDAAVAAFDAQTRDKLEKERSALATALQRIAEKERKAGRADVADAVDAALADRAPAGPAGNLAWDDFVAACRVTSQGLVKKGAGEAPGECSIQVGSWSATIGKGLTVVALVRGNPVLESSYVAESDLNSRLAVDLDRVPAGAYVIMALKGSAAGTNAVHAKFDEAIRRCGGKHAFTKGTIRTGYILIGRLGAEPGSAIELVAADREAVSHPSGAAGKPAE